MALKPGRDPVGDRPGLTYPAEIVKDLVDFLVKLGVIKGVSYDYTMRQGKKMSEYHFDMRAIKITI